MALACHRICAAPSANAQSYPLRRRPRDGICQNTDLLLVHTDLRTNDHSVGILVAARDTYNLELVLKRFGTVNTYSPPNLSESVGRFFAFMIKREQIRLYKEAGEPWPWSDDQILNTYKFTNVKREDDRTTRWMREFWTGPNEDRPAGEIMFNCTLFDILERSSLRHNGVNS